MTMKYLSQLKYKQLSTRRGIVALSIVALLIGVVIISATGLVRMEWGETGEETGASYSASITAYKDGIPVLDPIFLSGFERSGVEIDSLVMDITWVSTGTANIDWSTFVLTGSVKTYFLNPYDRYLLEYQTTFTDYEPTGAWSVTLVLGTDICKMENIDLGGWSLKFYVEIKGTVNDILGVPLEDEVIFPAGTTSVQYVTAYALTGEWNY